MDENLTRMTFADALHLALAGSGKGRDELAASIGVPPMTVNRWLSVGDHHWPSVLMLPRICCAAGNDLLVQWVQAQVRNLCLDYDNKPISPEALARQIVAMGREFGELAAEAEKALEDGRIDRVEALRLRHAVCRIAARGQSITNGIRPIG